MKLIIYFIQNKQTSLFVSYPEYDLTHRLDADDNEVSETITIEAGYLEFFMLNETEEVLDDGTRLHTYTKKEFSEYEEWKAIQEQVWS